MTVWFPSKHICDCLNVVLYESIITEVYCNFFMLRMFRWKNTYILLHYNYTYFLFLLSQPPSFSSFTIHPPVYKNMSDCMGHHPRADTLISFASLRSAYDSTMETFKYPQIRSISIIAEGIPENLTRNLNKVAAEKGVMIIGPATVSDFVVLL